MVRLAVAMTIVISLGGCAEMTEDVTDEAAVELDDAEIVVGQALAADLVVTSTVTPRYQRRFTWEMRVTPPPPVALAGGESRHVPFGVEITNTGTVGGGYAIDGAILLANRGLRPISIVVLVAYAGEVAATVTCPTAPPFAIAPGASVRCALHASLPNGRDRSLVALAIPSRGAPALGVTPFSFAGADADVQDLDRVVEATASGVGHVYLTDANFEPHVVTTYHRLIGPFPCGPFTSPGVASLRALTAPDSERSGLLMINVPADATGTVSCP